MVKIRRHINIKQFLLDSYNRQRKIRFLILILFVIGIFNNNSPLLAFGTKYGGEFLKSGIGVREMSLGGAVVSSPQNVSAFYWNPAGLTGSKKFSGQFMHSEEFAGILQLDQISFTFPQYGNFNYGIGFLRSGVDDIPYTANALIDAGSDGISSGDPEYSGPDSDGSENNGKLDPGERLDYNRIGSFGASESALFLSAAKNFRPNLDIGGSIKCIYKNLKDARAWGVGIDLGAIYQINSNWNLGASISDLTTTFLFWNNGGHEIIPPALRMASSYKIAIKSFVLQPFVGIDCLFEGEQHQADINLSFLNIHSRLGLEVRIKDRILLRCGKDEINSYHLGVGIKTPIGNIDYGFAMGGGYSALGNSHRLGLVIHFAEMKRVVKRYL